MPEVVLTLVHASLLLLFFHTRFASIISNALNIVSIILTQYNLPLLFQPHKNGIQSAEMHKIKKIKHM